MTTIFKCSIFSILKLEKFKFYPPERKILKDNVQICLKQQEFTIQPGRAWERQTATAKSRKRLPLSSYVLFVFAVFLLTLVVKLTFPYPLHASCLIKWNFGEPCTFVVQRLKSQIIKWSDYRYCGIKGLYKINELMPYENNTIRAFHITPQQQIIDDIYIIFAESSYRCCTALAESNSRNWYALFDDGRNYCNLHDLIVGAEYDNSNFFLEFTDNLICTQYDMAYCN